jgi:FkbM family methyltransferase
MMEQDRWRLEHDVLLGLLRDVLRVGDGFLDVGANKGIFTFPMAEHLGPEGRVYAFEPAPDMALDLLNEAARRGLSSRLELREMALGSENGTMPLRVDPDYPADSSKRSLFQSGDVMADVPVRTLDFLIAGGELITDPPIGAVKIDIEGAEVHALRGMRDTLRTQRPQLIVIETMEVHLLKAGFVVQDVHDTLGPFGYRVVGGLGLRYNTVFERTSETGEAQVVTTTT